ncbi:hypothetical protein D9M72_158850 [compost metagenome]
MLPLIWVQWGSNFEVKITMSGDNHWEATGSYNFAATLAKKKVKHLNRARNEAQFGCLQITPGQSQYHHNLFSLL